MSRFITFIKTAISDSVVSPTTEPACEHSQIPSPTNEATKKTQQKQSCTKYADSMSDATTFVSPTTITSRRIFSPEMTNTSCCASIQEAFQLLEQKYIEQREQRLRDKAIVDQAYEEVLSMQTHCKEVEDARRIFEENLQTKAQQQQREVEDKEEQLVNLVDHYHTTLDAINKAHAAELESAIRKAAEDRQEMEAAHLQAMRTVTEASKTNRGSWEKSKQSMEVKLEQMHCDFRDTLQGNREEITRLKDCVYLLEAENRVLIGAVNELPAEEMRERAEELSEEVQHTQSELAQTRTKLRTSHEKVENILKAMQQQRDHWEAHGDKENAAQAQVYDLQNQVFELREKLSLRDDLLRAADRLRNDTSTTCTESFSTIAFINEELREKLQAALEENSKLRARFNKVDNENFELCLKLDVAEEDLHNTRSSLEALQDKQSLLQREYELIIGIIKNHRGLSREDKELIQQHLHEIVDYNEHLRARNDELRIKYSELDGYARNVEDECENAVRKAEKEAAYWESMYWGEAVPKVETLLKEIHDLNQELGRENVHVQEHLERNVVVADKNALRHACATTLRGVDSDLISAERYEPGVVPGWIPATHDALRVLRPLGWAPVVELEKVWLAPMYKPFTEADAAYRLEAQRQTERKAHRANMGADSPPDASPEMALDSTNSQPLPVRGPSTAL